MDLGIYDDANLHDRLLRYHLDRPPIVVQQKPHDTLDKRVMEIRRLANRAFKKLFTPKKVISELKARRSRSEFYNREIEGIRYIDEFVFDANNELIAGFRYRAAASVMEVVRVVYRALDGLGLVLMYKKNAANLNWDNPSNVVGIQLDVDGNMVKDIEDLLKKQQAVDPEKEHEIIAI